jgi:hypothetical protein
MTATSLKLPDPGAILSHLTLFASKFVKFVAKVFPPIILES